MKAFIIACVAAILIAVVGGVMLIISTAGRCFNNVI